MLFFLFAGFLFIAVLFDVLASILWLTNYKLRSETELIIIKSYSRAIILAVIYSIYQGGS